MTLVTAQRSIVFMSSFQPTSPITLDLKPTFGWLFVGLVCAAVYVAQA